MYIYIAAYELGFKKESGGLRQSSWIFFWGLMGIDQVQSWIFDLRFPDKQTLDTLQARNFWPQTWPNQLNATQDSRFTRQQLGSGPAQGWKKNVSTKSRLSSGSVLIFGEGLTWFIGDTRQNCSGEWNPNVAQALPTSPHVNSQYLIPGPMICNHPTHHLTMANQSTTNQQFLMNNPASIHHPKSDV